MSIGRLIVELEARTGKFETDTGRAAKIMEKRAREIERQAKRIATAAAAAFTATAGAIAVMVKNSIDAADELSKLSQKVGVATDELSKLNYAADLAGVETASLQTALQRLSRSAVDMAQGTGESKDAFEALGVSVTDTEGKLKSTDTLLLELADAFAKFEDGPAKTAAAMDIFGKAGADLIPLLNGGADAIRSAGVELEKLGGVITPEAGRQAEAFNDNLSRLKRATTGVANQLAAELLPSLVSVTDQLVEVSKESNSVSRAADGLRVFAGVLIVPFTTLWNTLQLVAESFAAVGAAAAALARGDFAALDAIGEAFGEDRRQNIEDIKNAYNTFFGDVQEGAKKTAEELAKVGAPKASLNFSTGDSSGSKKTGKSDEEKQADEIQKVIAALQEESAAYGLSRAQLEARKLAQMGATDAQIQQAYEIAKYIGLQEKANQVQEEGKALTESLRTPLEQYQAGIARLNELLAAGAINQETYNRAVVGLQDSFDQATKGVEKIADATEKATDEMSVYADQAARNMQDAFADFLFDPFSRGLEGMLEDFANILQRMAAEAAAAEIFNALGFSGSGGGGGFDLGGLLEIGAGIFGFGMSSSGTVSRDSGGRGMAGQPYAIGTGAQPELFIPDTAGTFVPRDEWMGGGTVNNYITVPITAPSGTVGRQTLDQVSAAALAGAQMATRRNR